MQVVREAANQEIVRRFFRYKCEYAMGFTNAETCQKAELLMKELDLSPDYRRVVGPAMEAAQEAESSGKGNEDVFCGAAVELEDGTIVTGKNSALMHAASSLVLNAIKELAEIPDKIHLLAPNVIESIANLKKNIMNRKTVSLNLEETLIALSISATTNPTAQVAMEKLKELQGLRDPHHPHADPRRRGRPEKARGKSDEPPRFRYETPLSLLARILLPSCESTSLSLSSK